MKTDRKAVDHFDGGQLIHEDGRAYYEIAPYTRRAKRVFAPHLSLHVPLSAEADALVEELRERFDVLATLPTRHTETLPAVPWPGEEKGRCAWTFCDGPGGHYYIPLYSDITTVIEVDHPDDYLSSFEVHVPRSRGADQLMTEIVERLNRVMALPADPNPEETRRHQRTLYQEQVQAYLREQEQAKALSA